MPAQGLSFGTKANTVLDAVAKGSVAGSLCKSMTKDILFVTAACATDAYAAASLRHDGNNKFSAKEHTAAVEAYTEGKGVESLLLYIKLS